MDYKIQNVTSIYLHDLRAAFVEEYNVIPKHIKQELEQYIKMINEKSNMFVKEYLKLIEQDDKEATNKYMI